MLKLADRVKEATITQGSGLYIVLNGAAQAFQTFANTIGDGNSTYYTIENNNQFEVGIGTYRLSDNTLCRTTVLSSSNSNQRIVLDGISIVFCTYPASQATFLENGYIKSLSPQYSGIIFPDQTSLTSASGISELSLPSGLVYTNDIRLSNDRYPVPHLHNIIDVSGLQTVLDSKQPSGSYANLSHTHLIADVSGLQLALDGKQPSGNYAASSHTHTSSNITDFNSVVSGILPVINIVAGTNITVSPVSGIYTINSSGSSVSTNITNSSNLYLWSNFR
jgi:hypothetical protein